MAPSTNRRPTASKEQTRLNFKTVRRNASARLKPSKPTLVTAAASKETTKSKATKKRATRANNVSSDDSELVEVSEPEGTEGDFQSVRYTIPSHTSRG
jgi:hypothetical protein